MPPEVGDAMLPAALAADFTFGAFLATAFFAAGAAFFAEAFFAEAFFAGAFFAAAFELDFALPAAFFFASAMILIPEESRAYS
jgi:hypothetical protein